MDKWMYGHTDGQMDVRTYRWTNGCTDIQMDKWMKGQTDGQMDVRTYRWTNGRPIQPYLAIS